MFSNGSEGMLLDDECDECHLDYCMIKHVHLFYNYDQAKNEKLRQVMNHLVKEDNGEYVGCSMKNQIDDLMKGK